MKRYALYCCDASNHRMFITEDHRGNKDIEKLKAQD